MQLAGLAPVPKSTGSLLLAACPVFILPSPVAIQCTALIGEQSSLSPEQPLISCCLHPILQGPHNSLPLVPAAGQRLQRGLGGQGGRDAGEPARQAMTCSALQHCRTSLCVRNSSCCSDLPHSACPPFSSSSQHCLACVRPGHDGIQQPHASFPCAVTSAQALTCITLKAACQVPAPALALLSQHAVCQVSGGPGMAQNTESVTRVSRGPATVAQPADLCVAGPGC